MIIYSLQSASPITAKEAAALVHEMLLPSTQIIMHGHVACGDCDRQVGP